MILNENKLTSKIQSSSILCRLLLLAFLFVGVDKPAMAIWLPHNQPSLYSPISSKETNVTEQDGVSIRKVISGQLDAFRKGDGDKAFSYASPGIKQQFETSSQFFSSVKSAYEVVLVSRSIVFEDLKQIMGIVTQPVLFLASNGDTVIGSYIMEKQDNGDWKISGCYLAPIR
jgi:hypothetical protein